MSLLTGHRAVNNLKKIFQICDFSVLLGTPALLENYVFSLLGQLKAPSPYILNNVKCVHSYIEEMNKMEMDMNAMKAEVGGAFVLSWMVFGMGLNTIEGAAALAVVWMAFAGAHVLPIVTWCNMMTGDLGDVEGNWMANGMRLVAQMIGALLAILMATEFGGIETGWAATDMWITDIGDHLWTVIGMVAAGAVWWQVHSRCESAWASAFGLMALGSAMMLTGAHEMGASLASAGDGIVDTLANWIFDGLFVGVGALVGAKIDEML